MSLDLRYCDMGLYVCMLLRRRNNELQASLGLLCAVCKSNVMNQRSMLLAGAPCDALLALAAPGLRVGIPAYQTASKAVSGPGRRSTRFDGLEGRCKETLAPKPCTSKSDRDATTGEAGTLRRLVALLRSPVAQVQQASAATIHTAGCPSGRDLKLFQDEVSACSYDCERLAGPPDGFVAACRCHPTCRRAGLVR